MRLTSLVTSCSFLLLIILHVGTFGTFSPSSHSVMHLRADSIPPAYGSSLQKIISTLDDFDKSETLKATECFTKVNAALKELLPKSLQNEESFLCDIKEMMVTVSSMATREDELVIRLALMHGQKCPKWHEDFVKIRLLKAYHGDGTEYVNPNDNFVKLTNTMSSLQGKDLFVPPSKIEKCRVNDVLIIRGRKSKKEGFVPVLHRSPEAEHGQQRRLLLTITIP